MRHPPIEGDRAAKPLKIYEQGQSPSQRRSHSQNVNALHEEHADVGVQRSSSADLSLESVPVSPQTREHKGASRCVEWVIISDSGQDDVGSED